MGSHTIPGGAILTVSQTEVFSGTAPTTWTDLDLSGTIGAQSTIVSLKIRRGSFADTIFYTRVNGDTDDQDGDESAGANIFRADGMASARYGMVLIATDPGGIIEWKASAAATSVTVSVVAYIK